MTISSDMYSVLDNDSEISPKRTEEQRQANGKKTWTGRTGNSGETRLPTDYSLNILERI